MGRWCPRCGAEYVEGWGQCSTCGVQLVAERPPRLAPEPPAAPRSEPSFLEPGGEGGEDPFVAIWEGPTVEGAPMARRLEAAHIPVDLGEAAEPGRLRLEVPRSYLDEAYGVLDMEEAPPPEEPEDEWGPDENTGWSTGMRIAVLVVAIVLIAVLIITSR